MNRLRKNVIFSAPLRCALAFGRAELFIFKSLTAQLKLCPSERSNQIEFFRNLFTRALIQVFTHEDFFRSL